jgi:hypothetical protein
MTSDNEWMNFIKEYMKKYVSGEDDQHLMLEYCMVLIIYQNYYILKQKLTFN